MSLVLRLVKGSELTYAELDGNFTYLNGNLNTLTGSINSLSSSWYSFSSSYVSPNLSGYLTTSSFNNFTSSYNVLSSSFLQTSSSLNANKVPYTGATQNVYLGSYGFTASFFKKDGGTSSQFLKADGSIDSNSYLTSIGSGTTNELVYWSGSSVLGSLSTSTYPSLTELSYIKGVTGSLQNQINSKGTVTSVSMSLGNSGSDVNSSITNGTTTPLITLNIPDAGATTRGLITTGSQTISGSKAFPGDITVPMIIGGTSVSSILNFKSTTAVANSTAGFKFFGGTNGGTELAYIRNDSSITVNAIASYTGTKLIVQSPSGQSIEFQPGGSYQGAMTSTYFVWTKKIAVGVNSTPTAILLLASGSASANNAPLKFTAGTVLTTPESGAVETDSNNELFYSTSTTTSSRGYLTADRLIQKSADYTLTSNDTCVECTTNTFTITLPTAVGKTGRIFEIINTGTGTITIATTSSQTINGVSTKTLNTQYSGYRVRSNGSNWLIVASF